jgi:putative phosphoesterase
MVKNTFNLKNSAFLVGVISDTHGHLSKRADKLLDSVDLILHAGDIDTQEVLTHLQAKSPTVAVKGNMDWGVWTSGLHPYELVQIGPYWLYVQHDLSRLDLDPVGADISIVISGHTHQPAKEGKKGVLYLNPGSASYPRRHHSASMAVLTITRSQIDVQFHEVD